MMADGSESQESAELIRVGLRSLPSVDRLMTDPAIRSVTTLADEFLASVLRQTLERARADIQAGSVRSVEAVREFISRELILLERPRFTPIINGSGVIVHTNLGRSPVSKATSVAMSATAESYVPVEIDLTTGVRGGRMTEISGLMRLLTGAEATLVVNNNAAAILLVLSALAAGREVIVSRGEAVEIGGGFRIPDVLRQSGATLVEVGTTNRTHPTDYAEAITDRTGLVLKVHPSNFAITGFTRSVSVSELAAMNLPESVPIVEDLGSGALLDTARYGLGPEPTIAESLAAGAALVTASGDKLLGGPQAGIIAGRRDLIDRIAAHPLARAVRADKTCLAGLAATLRHYTRGEAEREIPVWRMISATTSSLEPRARVLSEMLEGRYVAATPVITDSTVGGGSLPGQSLASWALDVVPPPGMSVAAGAERLRMGTPPVLARVKNDRLLVDLRTVQPEIDDMLVSALFAAFGSDDRRFEVDWAGGCEDR